MASRVPIKWKLGERQKLEILLREGNTISNISKIMDLSFYNINLEIKRGLSEEAYTKSKKALYSHKLAIVNEMKEVLGNEQFEYIKEYIDEY